MAQSENERANERWTTLGNLKRNRDCWHGPSGLMRGPSNEKRGLDGARKSLYRRCRALDTLNRSPLAKKNAIVLAISGIRELAVGGHKGAHQGIVQ